MTLPVSPGPLASSPSGLWVGAVGRLYRIDPADGRILSTVPLRGAVSRLAVGPAGRLLYVAMHHVGNADSLPIQERDARSGALRAVSPLNVGFSANWLAATWDGVWMSVPTGMFGGAFFLRRTDLHQVGDEIESNQGVVASLAGGWLWVLMDLGRELICADPATGKRAGTISFGDREADGYEFEGNVVTSGLSLFVGTGAGLVEITSLECAS